MSHKIFSHSICWLILLVISILTISCSGESSRSGQSTNSETTNSSIANIPTMNAAPTNTAQTLTKEEGLEEETQQVAENYWRKIITKCGDTYYWRNFSSNSNDNSYVSYEAKGEPTIYIDKYNYFPPKQLTSADKLNNVDPQPVEIESEAVIKFEAGRKFAGDKCDLQVCPWKDDFESRIILNKSKGKWNIRLGIGGENKPVKCGSVK